MDSGRIFNWQIEVSHMATDYRTEVMENQYVVIDPWQEAPEAANQDIERCKREDRMRETAQRLVNLAIETHMQMNGVDRETARYWIDSAMGVT